MKRRKCGREGLELPVLGIGCWSFGGGEYWGEQSQKDVDEIVAAALDLGCNYFDTAEVYNDGRSESALGQALKGRRSRAIIGTKVSPNNTAPATLRVHCEASLKRLETDYIDLYMVHWPINSVSLQHYTGSEADQSALPDTGDAFRTLVDLKREGKIRHIGVSNYGVRQLAEIEGYGIAANQLCYNLLCRAIEFEILPLCAGSGIGVIGYMPLMQGILTGKYSSLEEIPWQRTRSRHFDGRRQGSRHGEEGFEALLEAALAELRRIAGDSGTPLMRLALAWCIAEPGIACTINGVRNVEQLQENVAALATTLSREVSADLAGATRDVKNALGPYADLYESRERSRIF
jgi:aryl-alcohol dehydrogenase-like predicted oxidoreductase